MPHVSCQSVNLDTSNDGNDWMNTMMPVLAASAAVRTRPPAEWLPGRSAIPFDEVLLAAERLGRWRIGATVAYRPLRDEAPRRIAQRLQASLAPLAGLRTNAQLLVQVATLGHDRILLDEVLCAADAAGVAVTLDLPAPERTDALLACAIALRQDHADLGLSLSCDRDRSLADADTACTLGLRLRLVQERRHETGAARKASAQAFARMVEQIAGRACHVTLVCHDPQIVTDSVARLRTAGTPVALELLPELPHQGVLWVARTHHLPIRSCVGYGHPQSTAYVGPTAHTPRVLWWSTLSNSLGTLLPTAGHA
jgi:proline dehydrogenase